MHSSLGQRRLLVMFLLLHLEQLFDMVAWPGDVARALAAGQVNEAAGVASRLLDVDDERPLGSMVVHGV
jgi:hypothetical protein